MVECRVSILGITVMIWESIPQCLGPFGVVKHRKGAFQGASPCTLPYCCFRTSGGRHTGGTVEDYFGTIMGFRA